jgi:excisionase family DNA binding protein
MRYTLGQAAKATGVSKMTIQRAVKCGRISGQKDDAGTYSLDPAEVHRVFPAVTEIHAEPVTERRSDTQELQVVNARLMAENVALKSMLEDARTERDRWHARAERLSPPVPSSPTERRWWQRLRG